MNFMFQTGHLVTDIPFYLSLKNSEIVLKFQAATPRSLFKSQDLN
jgi:hypothetical protein